MVKKEDKRFMMGWVSVALMLGVSMMLYYLTGFDLYVFGTVFFVGIGLILVAMSRTVPKNIYLTALGGVLAVVGGLILLSRPPKIPIDPFLLFGGIIAGGALAVLVYLYQQK